MSVKEETWTQYSAPSVRYEDVIQDIEDKYQAGYREEEQLDPETQARLDKARGIGVGLRTRPLVSGMVARGQIGQGLAEQYRRMRSGDSASQFATSQRGATVGSRVLQQQGPQMAREAGERFGVGMSLARVHRLAKDGQVLFAVVDRVVEAAHKQGIQLSRQAATKLAITAILGKAAEHDWDQYRTSKDPLSEKFDWGTYTTDVAGA